MIKKIKKYFKEASDRWYIKFLKYVGSGFKHWPED